MLEDHRPHRLIIPDFDFFSTYEDGLGPAASPTLTFVPSDGTISETSYSTVLKVVEEVVVDTESKEQSGVRLRPVLVVGLITPIILLYYRSSRAWCPLSPTKLRALSFLDPAITFCLGALTIAMYDDAKPNFPFLHLAIGYVALAWLQFLRGPNSTHQCRQSPSPTSIAADLTFVDSKDSADGQCKASAESDFGAHSEHFAGTKPVTPTIEQDATQNGPFLSTKTPFADAGPEGKEVEVDSRISTGEESLNEVTSIVGTEADSARETATSILTIETAGNTCSPQSKTCAGVSVTQKDGVSARSAVFPEDDVIPRPGDNGNPATVVFTPSTGGIPVAIPFPPAELLQTDETRSRSSATIRDGGNASETRRPRSGEAESSTGTTITIVASPEEVVQDSGESSGGPGLQVRTWKRTRRGCRGSGKKRPQSGAAAPRGASGGASVAPAAGPSRIAEANTRQIGQRGQASSGNVTNRRGWVAWSGSHNVIL